MRTLLAIVLSLSLVIAALGEDCTEKTTGTVILNDPVGVKYVCQGAPKCTYTYSPTKCVPKRDPESHVIYHVLIACRDSMGLWVIRLLPEYSNASDPTCVGRAPASTTPIPKARR
jgi:hypothetical protein